jgi:hypothetical protein
LSFGSHAIEVGGAKDGVAEATEISPAEIIAEDHDEVGFWCRIAGGFVGEGGWQVCVDFKECKEDCKRECKGNGR